MVLQPVSPLTCRPLVTLKPLLLNIVEVPVVKFATLWMLKIVPADVVPMPTFPILSTVKNVEVANAAVDEPIANTVMGEPRLVVAAWMEN